MPQIFNEGTCISYLHVTSTSYTNNDHQICNAEGLDHTFSEHFEKGPSDFDGIEPAVHPLLLPEFFKKTPYVFTKYNTPSNLSQTNIIIDKSFNFIKI